MNKPWLHSLGFGKRRGRGKKHRSVQAMPPPKERTSFDRPDHARTSIGLLFERKFPEVRITAEAHGKMWALVQECDIEIGWLSTCGRDGDTNFVIDDVFVPDQICGPASTTITKNGEAGLLTKLIDAGTIESINRLNCWGHSHVNMAVFASHVDQKQTDDFLERHSADHFLRVICNKRGELYASVYLHDDAMVVHHPKLHIEESDTAPWIDWAKAEIEEHVTREVFGPDSEFGDDPDFEFIEGWYMGPGGVFVPDRSGYTFHNSGRRSSDEE